MELDGKSSWSNKGDGGAGSSDWANDSSGPSKNRMGSLAYDRRLKSQRLQSTAEGDALPTFVSASSAFSRAVSDFSLPDLGMGINYGGGGRQENFRGTDVAAESTEEDRLIKGAPGFGRFFNMPFAHQVTLFCGILLCLSSFNVLNL